MSAIKIRELRDRTGAGVLDCKKALLSSDGDIKKAIEFLRIKGIGDSDRMSGRSTAEGIVYSYIHHDKQTGVLLELNCETDFVAINEKFSELAHNLALHIVACKPLYVDKESIPTLHEVQERELYRRKTLAEGKPAHIVDKIVAGRMSKFYDKVCLLNQPYILDDTKSVRDLIKSYMSLLGENIKVKQFALMSVGEANEV